MTEICTDLYGRTDECTDPSMFSQEGKTAPRVPGRENCGRRARLTDDTLKGKETGEAPTSWAGGYISVTGENLETLHRDCLNSFHPFTEDCQKSMKHFKHAETGGEQTDKLQPACRGTIVDHAEGWLRQVQRRHRRSTQTEQRANDLSSEYLTRKACDLRKNLKTNRPYNLMSSQLPTQTSQWLEVERKVHVEPPSQSRAATAGSYRRLQIPEEGTTTKDLV